MAYAGICGWQTTECGGSSGPWAVPDNCRHNGGENLGFMDGHVKWLSGSAIMLLSNANQGWPACCLPLWGGDGKTAR